MPTLLSRASFTSCAALLSLVVAPAAQATTVGPLTELATPATSQRAPAVSWDAQEQVYVLVWEDRRNAGSTGIEQRVAHGVEQHPVRVGPGQHGRAGFR